MLLLINYLLSTDAAFERPMQTFSLGYYYFYMVVLGRFPWISSWNSRLFSKFTSQILEEADLVTVTPILEITQVTLCLISEAVQQSLFRLHQWASRREWEGGGCGGRGGGGGEAEIFVLGYGPPPVKNCVDVTKNMINVCRVYSEEEIFKLSFIWDLRPKSRKKNYMKTYGWNEEDTFIRQTQRKITHFLPVPCTLLKRFNYRLFNNVRVREVMWELDAGSSFVHNLSSFGYWVKAS